ncbi:MAG TPA: insulinase family protein, partial [Candidatus Kapabacteria bacterium]|nr:insulinase family protein [Candidatus Kapabacteria bacterium]
STITEGVRSEQRYALAVFNTLLGDGMSSRLYQSIREKSGLAYSIYSTLQLLSDCGTLSIYAALDQSHIEYARESIRKEIDKLIQEPCSAKELRRMKLQVQAGIVMSLESMESRMTAMAKSILETGHYESAEEIVEKIGNVTAEEMCSSARLLSQEKISEVLFSPN